MRREVNKFIKTLQEKSLTIAFAESMTCGLVSERLSVYKGTSEIFKGSVVCYDASVKTGLFGISQRMVDRYTSESMEVTSALAKNLSRLIKADIHAAITGLAAAGGSETAEKPVGTVFFCMKYKGNLYKHKSRFYGSPSEIRLKACMEMYQFILSRL
jgi:nicotinamide-nucleotide amidase